MKHSTVADVPSHESEAPPESGAVHITSIVSLTADGAPEIHLDDDGPAVVAARLAVRASRDRLEAVIASRQPAVVVFEGGDRTKPLIIGFIESTESDTPAAEPAGVPVLNASVDGRRVRIEAQDEIVLECGSASVTLRRNGRVIIRGTYVETHADGTNRIKGGQVQLN
jgi:hypothetical protein